ncbi:MAG TPA: hypothetical protein VJ785_06020, partial [Anaerolineales bacterium]|nr:hypothetical protein [Anaerolineales bacterium]
MSILDPLFSPERGQRSTIPDSKSEPPQLTIVRTLVIVYEPTMDSSTGTKLSQYMRWNNLEELAKGYMSD